VPGSSLAVVCKLCQRLYAQRGLLLTQYDAAVAALAATERSDEAYAVRWDDIATLLNRLHKVERLTRLHKRKHGLW
jgi:hypothetical protein